MALLTPFGPLDTLNLFDSETQRRILGFDKHQLLEGLVVEAVGEQYISGLEKHPLAELADIVVFRAKQKDRRSAAWFVWERTNNIASSNLIATLSSNFPGTVLKCDYDFETSDFISYRLDSKDAQEPIQTFLARLRKIEQLSPGSFQKPQGNVQDKERMLEAFWGHLRSAYGGKLIDEVVLPRIFKNFGIQPFFTWGWDVDRIFSYDSILWQMELKHKYPFASRDGLCFGINRGQINLIKELADSGIKTIHIIMVKPVWSDKISPGYLHTRPELRQKVAILAKIIDSSEATRLHLLTNKFSGSKTTYRGQGRLSYVPVKVSEFHQVGTYADKVNDVLENILSLIEGKYQSPVIDSHLKAIKIDKL